MSALRLLDAASLADLGVLVGRARRVDPDGAVRLTAHGDVLVVSVAPLGGAGPLVLGLRVARLAEPSDVDAVVPLAAVADRLARPAAPGEEPVLALPPVQAAAAWAGVSPPRGGWEQVGALDERVLARAAADGVAEVAAGAPSGAGGHAVERLRTLVWSRPLPGADDVPAGAAFVADALGFLAPGEPVALAAAGRWRRLTTGRGHVLTRPRLL